MTFTLPRAACALAIFALTACGGAENGASDITSPDPAPETSGEPAPSEEGADPVTSGTPDKAAASQASAQFASLPAPYNAADYDTGRRIYFQCQSCHTLEEGGAVTLGPNLYGMFGTEVGAKEGFEYSDVLQEADFVWTPDRLAEWLANPRDFLPGNKMNFAGVQDEDERTAVIAYIMAETGYEPS